MTEIEFPGAADQQVDLVGGGRAHFGRNVLGGLVGTLDDLAREPRTERRWGPGLLGCSMWMDDPELIAVLSRLANVCVVVTKQTSARIAKEDAEPLRALAETAGLAQSAYPELGEYAARVGRRPMVVGPGTPDWTDATSIGGVREVGFRRSGDHLVPIVHAKMALVGDMCWTDEHPSAAVIDELWFEPRRLWIGSANFTRSSRRSLEVGMWTADATMLAAARRFLTTLVSLSEPLGRGPAVMEPELLPVEYDDAAFSDYVREFGWTHERLDDDG